MHRSITALVALTLLLGFALAQETPAVRTDLTPNDLDARPRRHGADDRLLQAREFRASQGGAGTVTKRRQPRHLLVLGGQSDLRAGRAVQARQCAVPQALGVVAGLDRGVGRARAAVQCARLPELPPQGRARASAVRQPAEQRSRCSSGSRCRRGRRRADRWRSRTASGSRCPSRPTATQLQDFAVQGLKAEGQMVIDYTTLPVTLGDGTVVELRQPTYAIADLAYGPTCSRRDDLAARRAADDRARADRADPARGHPRAAPIRTTRMATAFRASRTGCAIRRPATIALGRFGWKAGRADDQVAVGGGVCRRHRHLDAAGECAAWRLHRGSRRHASTRATGEQERLGVSEAPDPVLDLVTFYSQNLGVPQRRDVGDAAVLRGQGAVLRVPAASSCHTPKFVTSRDAPNPAQKFQLIWPYSDFLLHDMGEGLADHRPEGDADGYEWRTPPLWGIGLTETGQRHTFFLHDGRARNLTEAILWHGGEAQASRDAFAALSADRARRPHRLPGVPLMRLLLALLADDRPRGGAGAERRAIRTGCWSTRSMPRSGRGFSQMQEEACSLEINVEALCASRRRRRSRRPATSSARWSSPTRGSSISALARWSRTTVPSGCSSGPTARASRCGRCSRSSPSTTKPPPS